MSSYSLYLLSFLLAMLACSDDDLSSFEMEVSAKFNGEPWTGNLWAIETQGVNGKVCELPTIQIAISKFNDDGFQREQLNFSKVYPKIGSYLLKKTEACDIDTLTGADYYTLQEDGDVLEDLYEVLESEENYLIVTSVEPNEAVMTCDFQVTFIIDQSRSKVDVNAPDTIRFTEGTLSARISE